MGLILAEHFGCWAGNGESYSRRYRESKYAPVADASVRSPVLRNLIGRCLPVAGDCSQSLPEEESRPVGKNLLSLVSTANGLVSVKFPPVDSRAEVLPRVRVARSQVDDQLFAPSLQTGQQKDLVQ